MSTVWRKKDAAADRSELDVDERPRRDDEAQAAAGQQLRTANVSASDDCVSWTTYPADQNTTRSVSTAQSTMVVQEALLSLKT